MNTPAHLIFGLSAFGQPERPRVTTAALLGAFVPDLSLYAMVGASIWVLGIPPRRVFRELYYSDAWQQVFAIDNSFVVWGAALALALWRRSAVAIAFTGAAFLHLIFDFPLHNHDARMHFWPLSRWVFESPVSYWDDTFHARIVGPLELGVSMLLCLLLLIRFRGWAMRGLILALGAMETMSSGIWRYIF